MRRRTPPAEPAPEPVQVVTPPKPGGKGRPTPKRSEAQGKRKTAVRPPPMDRKEAARRMRDDAREARLRQRLAMQTGDESNFPPLHAGKERALVRDVVDSRRSIAWIGLPAFLVLMIGLLAAARSPGVAAVLNLILLVLAAAMFTDTILAYRKVKQVLAERFPTGTREKTTTLALYGVSRNNQIPARRKPPARVKRGQSY